jgi:hypothetical protein
LRLDGDDPRAEAAERGDAVADVAANVEHEVAGAGEARIAPVERAAPPPVAVVDAQRPDDAARRPDAVEHHVASSRRHQKQRA